MRCWKSVGVVGEEQEQEEEADASRTAGAALQLHVLSLRLHAPVDRHVHADARQAGRGHRLAKRPAVAKLTSASDAGRRRRRSAAPPPDLVAAARDHRATRRPARGASAVRRSNAPLALGDEKTAETEKYGASGDGDAAARADRSRTEPQVVPEDVRRRSPAGRSRPSAARTLRRSSGSRGVTNGPKRREALVARARAQPRLRARVHRRSQRRDRGASRRRRRATGDACPAEIVDALARGECRGARAVRRRVRTSAGAVAPGLASASRGCARRLQRSAEEAAARGASARRSGGEGGSVARRSPSPGWRARTEEGGKPF